MRKKVVRFHRAVERELRKLPGEAQDQIVVAIADLVAGESLGMPLSRPMPVIENGAHELRISDRAGEVRVFYFTKEADALLVFHLFRKKSQKAPQSEIETARKRLKQMREP